jgi:hypothetical protein
MAKRIERRTCRVIYAIPSPSPLDVLEKEIGFIRKEYQERFGELWDNVPMIESHDDEIHLWYEVKEDAKEVAGS